MNFQCVLVMGKTLDYVPCGDHIPHLLFIYYLCDLKQVILLLSLFPHPNELSTMGVPTLQARERQMTYEPHSGPKGSVPLYPPNLIHTTPFHKLSAQGESNFLVYP